VGGVFPLDKGNQLLYIIINMNIISKLVDFINVKLLHFYIYAQGSDLQADIGFKIPTLGSILTFLIRFFFIVSGLAALLYLLLGAFAWITSGGDKENVTKAREKIQAAVIGVILIIAVIAVIWTLEEQVFKEKICFGVACKLTIPSLVD